MNVSDPGSRPRSKVKRVVLGSSPSVELHAMLGDVRQGSELSLQPQFPNQAEVAAAGTIRPGGSGGTWPAPIRSPGGRPRTRQSGGHAGGASADDDRIVVGWGGRGGHGWLNQSLDNGGGASSSATPSTSINNSGRHNGAGDFTAGGGEVLGGEGGHGIAVRVAAEIHPHVHQHREPRPRRGGCGGRGPAPAPSPRAAWHRRAARLSNVSHVWAYKSVAWTDSSPRMLAVPPTSSRRPPARRSIRVARAKQGGRGPKHRE